jgi:hypothetical protein
MSDLPPLLVSVKKARELLGGVGNNQIWRLIKRGELDVCGSRRKRWVSVSSIQAYVGRQLTAAAAERDAVRASKQAEAANV